MPEWKVKLPWLIFDGLLRCSKGYPMSVEYVKELDLTERLGNEIEIVWFDPLYGLYGLKFAESVHE